MTRIVYFYIRGLRSPRYDPSNDSIRIFPISDEELAAPAPHPHDFDFKQIIVQGMSAPIGRAPDPDLLGGSTPRPYVFVRLAVQSRIDSTSAAASRGAWSRRSKG
jgi:hypothetical protein